MPSPMSRMPSPSSPTTRRALLLLASLLVLLGFAFQGTRALWSTDEGRYTINALQMVESGHWQVPAYNADRTNLNKPPMTAWAIAASLRTFGHSEWAVRAPYALAFILTALLLAGMGRTLVPDKPWLPGLVYATSLLPFIAANIVSTDTLLTLFEALAAYGFVRGFLATDCADRTRRVPRYLMWLGFGLAFLTKGPPGLLPLLGMLAFVVLRDGWRGLGRLFTPVGLLLFALAGLGWYALVIATHPGLLEHYLKYEVYDRVFTRVHDRHGQWYGWILIYVPTLLLGTLPWWPAALRRGAMTKARFGAIWRNPGPGLFLGLWFALPMAIFILSRSRLPLYLLPLFLPLSLLLARAMQARIDLSRTTQRVLLGVWLLVLLAIKGGAAFYAHPARDNLRRSQTLTATMGARSFDALVFVRATPSQSDVTGNTPWGMRFYLHVPVYGVAWLAPGGPGRTCMLARRHASALFLLNNFTLPERVRAGIGHSCPDFSMQKAGAWAGYSLWTLRPTHAERP